MKFLLPLLFLFSFAPAAAQKLPADAISTYFAEYVDDPDFTVVYVSGKIFELFKDSNLDIDELEEEEVTAILKVVKDIQGIRILATEHQVMRHWKEAKSRIPTDKYELLFKVRTAEGDNVEAFIQDEKAVISELFLLIGAENTFVMLSFVGNVDLTQLAQLQRALEDR